MGKGRRRYVVGGGGDEEIVRAGENRESNQDINDM